MTGQTFSLPEQPPHESKVQDTNGFVWKRTTHEWRCVDDFRAHPKSWDNLLATCGPLELVEEVEDERWKLIAEYLWPDVLATSKKSTLLKNGSHAVVDLVLKLYAPGVERQK